MKMLKAFKLITLGLQTDQPTNGSTLAKICSILFLTERDILFLTKRDM